MKKITTLCMSLLIAMTVSADEWNLVKDASTLQAGDQIVLAYADNSITAAATLTTNGSKSSYWLAPVSSTFSGENLLTIGDATGVFTLAGEAGAWKFAIEGANGTVYLGATKAKFLSYDAAATNTWTITINEEGGATIASTNSAIGTLYYNSASTSNRFCVYTSTSGMRAPQIYRLFSTPAYALEYEGYPYQRTMCELPTYYEGTVVKLSAGVPVKEDDEFKGWQYGETLYQPGADFTMPGTDVVLKPVWKSDPTALKQVVETPKATKVIRNGQLFIVRDGVEYNVIGVRVK